MSWDSPAASGRRLPANAFAGDTGAADPAVAAAPEALAAAPEGDVPGRENAERAALGALAESRVLVPLMPGEPRDGGVAGGSPDLVTVRLKGPDGRHGYPVFTSLDALTAWEPTARPIPTPVPQACRQAVEDFCDVALLDLAGPAPALLRTSMLWALGRHLTWLPPHREPRVGLLLRACPRDVPGLVAAEPRPGGPADPPGTLCVELRLRDGLSADQVQSIAEQVGQALALDPEVRSRLDDVRLVIRRAEPTSPPRERLSR